MRSAIRASGHRRSALRAAIVAAHLLPCLAVFGSPASAQTQAPVPPLAQPFTERINEFPALWQRNRAARLPGDGSKSCGPVAASNALMWLAEHGFPEVLPEPEMPRRTAGEREAAQIALLHAFTAEPYVRLSDDRGSSPDYVARGLRRYLEDRGCQIEQLEWRTVAPPMPAPSTPPPPDAPRPAFQMRPFTLDDLKAALRSGAAVWLGYGHYRPIEPASDVYVRVSGHAVTLVGYGRNANGRVDPSILIVHDPDRRNGTWPHFYLPVIPLKHGYWPSREVNGGQGPSMAGRRYEILPEPEFASDSREILETATILRLKPLSEGSSAVARKGDTVKQAAPNGSKGLP